MNLLNASKTPHVALLVETSLGSGRDILLGIARYVREHQPWLLYHEARSLEDSMPGWLEGWKGQGIIARVQTPAMAAALAKTRVPVVDVLGVVSSAGLPLVHVDDHAIGVMAAKHLLDRGLRSFAFLGLDGENWSEARHTAFSKEVGERGFQTAVRRESRHEIDDVTWEVHQDELKTWLANLPKPVGIMVCSDQRGSQVLDACRRAGLNVPDEVAIIGVDNDEPLCSVCNPPLSSVWPNHSLVGYEAAVLLARLMQGEKRAPKYTLIPPKKIITRQSTDTLALEDTLVSAALKVIRDRAVHRVRVDDIASVLGTSRSVLQRRFRSALGRTINEELVSQRLRIAERYLLETNLSLIEIAERSGFQHQEYMGSVFRDKLGITPAAYRKKGKI
jgi:LacI family transcriptional regulator